MSTRIYQKKQLLLGFDSSLWKTAHILDRVLFVSITLQHNVYASMYTSSDWWQPTSKGLVCSTGSGSTSPTATLWWHSTAWDGWFRFYFIPLSKWSEEVVFTSSTVIFDNTLQHEMDDYQKFWNSCTLVLVICYLITRKQQLEWWLLKVYLQIDALLISISPCYSLSLSLSLGFSQSVGLSVSRSLGLFVSWSLSMSLCLFASIE
jgi:hypothetical protein